MGTTGPAGRGTWRRGLTAGVWRLVGTGACPRRTCARRWIDGRIAPKARVYESDWTQMIGTTDLDERLQLATAIKGRLTGVYRYYEQRLSRVNEEIDAIHAQRPMRLDLDPVLSDKG